MDVAIVGIGCRFPGDADTPADFWQLLCDGVDAITELPAERFDIDEVYDPDPAAPGKIYSRWGGFVADVDRFDADFFGIAPREAKQMDPQHRLLLEVAWEALEDGGQVPERLAGTSTGVYVGVSTHDYGDMHMGPGQRHLLDPHVNIGNALCAAPNRLSYLLDLRGPSMAIETACSSSLTAVHLACRSLAADETSMAIAAGVNLVLAPDLTVGFCKASMISPDGRCRAFDARANGYVRSEGAGAVVLKPLAQALGDGDPIYAVVRSSAINEDGRTTGISLPSAAAQEQLLQQALREADLDPAAISYVETHGTGTAVGDPAEAQAIGQVYGRGREPEHPLVIGSAKTNVGHLEAGAGITGLIKAALMLRHKKIPPSLHFEHPNPDIPFAELRLRVPTELEAWPETARPALAGVNAFGFGGANAHVVLAEAPAAKDHPVDATAPAGHVLTISGRSQAALREAATRHREHLRDDATAALHDRCYTAAMRRTHHEHRLAVVGSTADELVAGIETFLDGDASPALATGHWTPGRTPGLAFVFAGMGPQWWGMGRQLLRDEPVFRAELEECDRALRPLSGWSLLDELTADEAASRISETRVVQVVNCAFQIALAALWRSWGVVPDAVVGHSAGEMAAAHVAGALDRADALRVAYHRGRLLHRATGTGTMLAAGISAAEAATLVAPHVDQVALAAVNSPSSVTLSGDRGTLEDLARMLEQRERFCRFLQTEVPYHAPQVEGVRAELLEALADLEPRPVAIPMVSEVTGAWVGDALLDGDYWWRNIRQPVLFAPCVETLIDDGHELFCELSPHPALTTYVDECLAAREESRTVVHSLRRHEDEREAMLRALAALHVRGRVVDWAGVYPHGACITLPTYPWQRERHWFDQPAVSATRPAGVDTHHPLLGRQLAAPHPAWQGSLADPRLDYLDAHVVEDSAVFPGAGYVEMAIAAARRLHPETPVTLERVEFSRLLFLAEGRDHALHLLHHPRDAALEVHSADDRQDTAWTLHATAALRTGADARLTGAADDSSGHLDLSHVRERCREQVAPADYYGVLEQYGFRYGAPFRGLRDVRAGEHEALALVGFPAGVDLPVDAYAVHPALLDSAFQLLVAAAGVSAGRGEEPPGPLFPVALRRVAFHHRPGGRFWAHAVVRHADGALIEGDVTLVGDDGTIALTCEGLRLTVLEKESGGSAAEEDIDSWLYDLQWEEVPGEGADTPRVAAVRPVAEVRAALATGAAPEQHPDIDAYYALAAPGLDRLAVGYTRIALETLGWSADHADHTSVDRLGVDPRHRQLFGELVRMVEESGGTPVPGDHAALRGELDALRARAPAFTAEADLVRRGGEALADVLRGDTDPREVLLTDEALELLARMYHNSPTCRAYHPHLANAVAAALDAAPDGAPLRVLEVGAGTGAATAGILPALPAGAEYVFTDISPHFVATACERFGARSGMRFEVLDVETDPSAQGFTPGSFDVVVAANVLHTTADLRTTAGHLRTLLAPGGVLAVLELTRRAAWYNLVFGLLDGWWRFTDTDLRPAYPLLGPEQWRGLLTDCGYEQASALDAGERAGGPRQTGVLARAPVADPAGADAATPRRWLLLTDEGGVGARLAAELRGRGDTATLVARGRTHRRRADGTLEVPPDDAAAFERLLADLRGSGEDPDGVVHLWGLDTADSAGPAASTAAVMDAQRLGSESALALAQALEAAEPRPSVWLITGGSQPVPGHDDVPAVAQAPLWGLGRVLMNEQAAARCRLVDLSPEPTRDEVSALAAELGSDDPEEELALRGPRRFVRRLQRASLGAPAQQPGPEQLRAADSDRFCLAVDTPGTLASLVLRAAPDHDPGPGEVALRVRASGLNFRDVLLALGMLPDAAKAVSPAPDLLGIECSGVVLACGAGVDEFQPGDEVIALAWGSHGSRVLARASLTVPKPAALTFAEAASVTTAFVTADYALRHVARVEPGERVLIHSAAGAVGLAAIQCCERVGAEVFATAGTPEKRDHLRSLGIEHVLDSRSLNFADEVRQRTDGHGVDVVLNSLAGEAMRASLDLLRPYGRFVELGKRDIYDDAQVGLAPFQRNLTYTAVDLIQLALDQPERAKRLLLDVMQQLADGRYTPVPYTVFDLGEAEQAFRLMAQARHIGKVVLTVDETHYPVSPEREPALCQAEGTYLITGGLGGLGLAVADWLVRQGARTVVLMSRSGRPKDDGAGLEALRASARVVVVQGDVGNADDVARVLARIRAELPPLRGVVHAAMVLDDDVLGRLDRERFRGVLEPKVAGAWNLHRLTTAEPLDFFVLFSSLASVFGHPLQGNYAAANAFLDALATHRQARGLPALTVGWGAVADVGYVARHPEVAEYVFRGGLVGFTPEQAVATLGALLRRDRPYVIAARIDWPIVTATNPALTSSRRFLPFATAAEHDGGREVTDADATPLALLDDAAPQERRAALERYVVGKVARVLGGTADRVDPDRPLPELGFDSLMAVELTTALKTDLKVRVPVVRILQGASARDLAGAVLDRLSDAAPDSDTDAASDDDEAYPLSFEQRRLWFLHCLEPDNPAYNIPTAARLAGPLDAAALERSLNAAVERHEVLRATFQDTDGEPAQTFAPAVRLALPVADLSDQPLDEREAELQRRATAEIRRPFDLEHGPPVRVLLFRLAPDEHVLLLVVHHIACDAWSMNWFAREVAALYEASSAQRPADLPPPAFRYVDYVRREHERLDDDLVSTQLDYWTRTLTGAQTRLRMPGPGGSLRGLPAADAAHTPRRGGHEPFALTSEVSAALEQLSRTEGVTLFTTLLAAFQTLLRRYSGQDDVCVATPVTTRDPEAETVVGCFMNTLVLRGDLGGDPTFRELLKRTHTATLDAFEHQDVPFERVVEAVRAARGGGPEPLFEAMLVLHNARLPELRVAGLDLRPVDVESGTAVTDLALLLDTGERLRGVLEYNADRFDRATVRRMLEHLRILLEGVVADPDRRLSELPLMTPDERHRVVVEWNHTAVEFGASQCLHELVAAQVQSTPHAVAVASANVSLTYAALERRSNRLAHHLRALGVGPERIVGVCMERSTDVLVATLAVLKAGGAFLPLDPTYPADRLRFQLEDANAAAVLTQQRLQSGLPATRAPVVAIDGAWEDTAPREEEAPRTGVGPRDLAYVIYTSGSTGTPKGVMVEHRAVCNHLRWRQHAIPLTVTDTVLQRTPLTFDPSVWELFGPLTAGARVLMAPPTTASDSAALVRLVADEAVTVLQAVPAVLEALVDEPELDRCQALRRVICGGEPLATQLQERLLAQLPVELHHVYGPTEATIETTHWRCGPTAEPTIAPIGRPIANATVHILDDALQPVPIGAVGELCIGGAGLTRGYLDRPDLTAQRFIPHPWHSTPGARLYRSGDLGRWRPDGNIEFLGRADQQVKVRGFRVEPGEVEAALHEHAGIREVAVVACEPAPGDRRLVAFATVAGDHANVADLHRHAADRLPDYMLPSSILLRDDLPRTASGKVDRERLVHEAHERAGDAPHGPGSGPPSEPAAPRDPVELRLVQIWEGLFPGCPVGVTDDFFDLGGHSLLAMRATARIRAAFGADLPVSSLIAERTIERLACLLRAQDRPRSPLVALQPRGDERPFVWVHPVSGTVFCYVELARAMGAARPFYAFEAVGLRAGEQPHDQIEDMAANYVAALRELQATGPYLLGGWSMGGMIAFEMARQLEAAGEHVAFLALLDTPHSPALAEPAHPDQGVLLHRFAQDIGLSPDQLTVSADDFWQLDPDAQLTCLLEQPRATGLLPPDMGMPELRRHLRVLTHNSQAMRAHVPRHYAGRLTLFEARDRNGDSATDNASAWGEHAGGGVTRYVVAGNHYTMLRQPHVDALAAQLGACLDELQAVTA